MLNALIRGYGAWKRRQAERRDLLSLSDRELADIGISRTDVDRIVSQAARDARR